MGFFDQDSRRPPSGEGSVLRGGYAELSCFTNYSFLHGGSSPEELALEASRLGLTAIAVTDLHGVYGMPKMWGALKELPNPPKLLVGAQLPLSGRPEDPKDLNVAVNLFAKTRAGYGALCRIFTEAHRNAPKGKSSLSLAQFLALMESTPGTSDLFLFPQWETRAENAQHLDDVLFASLIREFSWISHFPRERIYLPLSRMIDGRDQERTTFADRLAAHFDRDLVAHNRVLYHHADRRRTQDTLTCIREGKTFKTAGYLLKRNEEAYLKPPEVMRSLFHDRPELLDRGLAIAEACTFLPSELKYEYPSEWIPAGHTSQSYLESICAKGMCTRYGVASAEAAPESARTQLAHEVKLIGELKYADYFLTVYDIVEFAREKGILCQGRGSAANSIVCYVMGITAINPIQMGFLFERFISVERGEPPDIDVDFEHERREEVLQYVYAKYGRDRAAMLSAVSTYGHRSALRETAKVFGVDVGTLSARKVEKVLADPEITDPAFAAKISRIADELNHFPRHLSIHSGGFTLSAGPIVEIVPVEPATMEGRTIIQWDKYDLDILGLLKVDLLALGMLSALRKGLEMVGLELYKVPHDDPATYAMIQRADTIGTFQIESRAQMAMLPRLLPKNFYDLVVEVALVRPGPIVGKMVHPYLKRRRGEEKWSLPHPALEPILGRTFGVPIFQEQIMKMAIAIGGFTPGDADKLRKAIGAWRSAGSIDSMGRKLKEGLLRAGIPEDFSQRIFEQIQGFSEYGFPESHAASFALLAYVSCYLKCHHPTEFLVAMLNSQPLGFYASHTLIDDAKRNGVTVFPISAVHSDWQSKRVGDLGSTRVRLGFQSVGGLGEEEWKRIEAARAGGAFLGLQDFLTRISAEDLPGRKLRRNTLRMMAVGDVFREFGLNQRESLWQTLAFDTLKSAPLFHVSTVQSELFSPTAMEAMGGYEEILSDYQATGLSPRGHPMEWIRKKLRGQIPEMNSQLAKKQPNGSVFEIPGLSLVLQRPPTASGTAFATLEDEFGLLDLVLKKEVYTRVRAIMEEEPFVVVRGQLQRDGLAASMVVREVRPFSGTDPDEMTMSFSPSGDAPGEVKMPDAPGSIARHHTGAYRR
jgi:error-prone DNA polymerase